MRHAIRNLLGAALVSLSVSAQGQVVSVTITDWGINQWERHIDIEAWSDSRQMGADFSKFATNVEVPTGADIYGISTTGAAGQILIPMPPDADIERLGKAGLRDLIRTTVEHRISQGLAQNQTNFEIRLVQNINSKGYFSLYGRQPYVEAFGEQAYRAIGDAFDTLAPRVDQINSYAIAASNGAVMLAKNADAVTRNGKVYLDGADFVDGRAHFNDVLDFIRAIGPEKVRTFTTKHDHPAPNLILVKRSMGNFNTIRDLKRAEPTLRTYYLVAYHKGHGGKELKRSHVSSVTKDKVTFTAREYLGDGAFQAMPLGLYTARDFRMKPTRSGWQSVLTATPTPYKATLPPVAKTTLTAATPPVSVPPVPNLSPPPVVPAPVKTGGVLIDTRPTETGALDRGTLQRMRAAAGQRHAPDRMGDD